MWFPTPFIGYFSHHDGLMVTTVSQLQNAIRNGGPWPFNQYGSFWAFVFALPTWNIEHEYLLVSMRLMTLVFYFITAWLTYKIARLFCEPPFALAGVILLLGNQAFLFDLLPWPSAVAMPLITLVSFLLLRKLSRVENSPNRSALEVVTIGIIIPMVILTRVQIGFILFVISLIFIFFFGSKKETAIFFLSFLTSIGIFFGYLSSNGWLVSSLQDQLLFGSSYLGSDTNPIPIFTSIGVFTVVLFFALSDKLMIKVNNTREKSRIVIIAICLFLILMLVAITIMARRLMNPFSMYVLVAHRIWISVILGAIIYFTLVQIKKSYEAWQMHSFFDRDLQVKNLLALLSITSQLQIYPLFDQMHSWWGSTPGVVVILLIYKEKYQVADILVSQEKRLAKSMVVATLVLTLLPYAIQTMNLGKIVSSPYLGGIFVPQNSADEILTLQTTFEKNLSPGASVLNLCSDPDIFLNSKYPNSESRIFIFWPEFLKIEYLRKTFQESSPQWIVSCFPESRKAEDLKIFQEYVNEGSSNFVLVHSVRNLLGRDWQIWKK
jgi:hypothetical protein